MNVRRKTFSLLSVVVIVSIITYIWWYSHNEYRRLQRDFLSLAENYTYAFHAEFDSVRDRMLQLAMFTANDDRVQQLMSAAGYAVTEEGGGEGGVEAARIRRELFAHLSSGMQQLSIHFNIVALHFHLMPEVVSFLRFHQPAVMGDPLKDLRPMIVAVGREKQPLTGFETGLYFSGIRAAVPIFAPDTESGAHQCVGVVEFGIPMKNMLAELHADRPWLEAALLLDDEYLRTTLVPEKYAEFSGKDYVLNAGKRLSLTATTAAQITDFLQRKDFKQRFLQFQSFMFSDAGVTYNAVAIPLNDFAAEHIPGRQPVGAAVVWHDVSTRVAAYRQMIHNLILYGVFLFLALEAFIYLGLYLVSAKLKDELEHQRRLERVSGRALEAVSTIGLVEQQPQVQLSRILQDQLNDAVRQLNVELGMFISSGVTPEKCRIIAVSEMVWSNSRGTREYNHARNLLLQQGYVPIHLGESVLSGYLREGTLVSLDEDQCNALVKPILPPGHPHIRNLLFVPVQVGAVQLGALILANSYKGFEHREQIVAQAYAAAAALLMHSDLREVERLSAIEAARIKEDLLRNLSHELRTPLNVIHGMSRNLNETRLDDMQQHYISQVRSATQRLIHLTEEVLFLTELDSDVNTGVEPQRFRPEALLQGVADEFKAQANARGIALRISCSNSLPSELEGDTPKIIIVLRQLLDNAIKFSRNNEVVMAVEDVASDVTSGKGVTVRFALTDHGIGVAPEQQETIFEPFYQCDTSRVREYEGAGLGLSVAQKVCTILGTSIRLESSIGVGSTFYFDLVLHAVADNALTPAAQTQEALCTDASITAKPEAEAVPAGVKHNGSVEELLALLHRLEEPLLYSRPQPCNEIALRLKSNAWPEWLAGDVDELLGHMSRYRYAQALEMVHRLQMQLESHMGIPSKKGVQE